MTSKYLSSVYKRQGIGTAILLIGLVLLALLSASCKRNETPLCIVEQVSFKANGIVQYDCQGSFARYYFKHAYYQIGDTIQ